MGSKAPVKRNPRQQSGGAARDDPERDAPEPYDAERDDTERDDPERDDTGRDDLGRDKEVRNEGEGSTTADRNYRKATQNFVESERGQREIGKARQVAPEDAEEIRRAEEEAKAHAKEHDPTEISDRSRPA